MDWGQIENGYWFLFVAIFIGLSVYVQGWRKSTRKKFADEHLIEKLFPKNTHKNHWKSTLLIALGLIFAVLALMDPLYGEEEVQLKREGIDLVYALDLSNSMLAEDVGPNRLEKAKKLLVESMERLGGDRVGLLVFAADAYAISPLTHDYQAIRSYVNTASPHLISYQGTNFAAVVNQSVAMFDNAPNTSKTLVILSDGEDNEESVKRAIQLAKEHSIHVVTIGIGTQNGSPIPFTAEQYRTDSDGQVIISKLDETTMRNLSEKSAGIYIHARQNQETLDQLHAFLNRLEKNPGEESLSQNKKHIFQWFLGLAFLLIFIDTLTSEHKLFNNKKQ